MPAWGGYANGAIPLSVLVVRDAGRLHPAAAWNLDRLNVALEKATGHRITLTEGYRSRGIEADRLDRTPATTSDHTTNQWYQRGRWLRGETPSAAVPGTSVHGWALAGDFGGVRVTAEVWAWLLKHGPEFGWFFGVISSEDWHGEYRGSLIIPAVIAATIGDKQMEILKHAPLPGIVIRTVEGKKTWFTAIAPDGTLKVRTGIKSKYQPYADIYGAPVPGTPADVTAAKAARLASVQWFIYVEGSLLEQIAATDVAGFTALIVKLRVVKSYAPKTISASQLALVRRTVPTPSA